MHDILLLGAAICYLLAAFIPYRELLEGKPQRRQYPVIFTSMGAIAHGIAQASHWINTSSGGVNFLTIMSLCALVMVLLMLASLATPSRLFDAGLIALPLAAALLMVEYAIPAPGGILDNTGPAISVHVVTSIMAFSFLGLAGIYAVFVFLADYFLKRHHLNRLVRTLPSLSDMEALLFGLIKVGFALLTLSLVTGLIFVYDIFAQHLAHKTILSIIAWFMFGTLLLGRWLRGWRGSTAVRLTIIGVVLLLLSYFGSKLVLEVLLGKNWG